MIDFFILAIILFLSAGIFPIILMRERSLIISSLLLVLGGIFVSTASLPYLFQISYTLIGTASMTPFFPVILGIDRLSAAFTLLLGILSVTVGLYAPGYIKGLHPGKGQFLLSGLIPFFIGSMLIVLLSGNTFTFLLSWEIMAILSFFLVLTDYFDSKTRYAAFFYFVMTQISTIGIFLGIISLYLITNSFTFPVQIRVGELSSLVVFLLLFAGVAIKSGVIPVHKWLVYAHPAAPSPVSALMSGLMLNCALYLLFRMTIDFFAPSLFIGCILLLFGSLSAVFGVIYAVKEQDLKRLLAYSSIDNTGIILIGIGLYSLLTSTGLHEFGRMALLGALFHAVSHGLFKGLLFLASGSVNQVTGTRNIDDLGGLLVRMPYTGALFCAGILAASAIPPFNGFVGELLIYQAFLQGFIHSDPLMQVILVIGLALFGLCGALTALTMVKAFGLTFLALPRTQAAKDAREVRSLMYIGPALLAVLCLATGIFSSQILTVLGFPGLIPDLLLVSIMLLCVGILCYGAVYYSSSRDSRISSTWGCGMSSYTNQMEYTGSGFTQPVVRILTPVYRTRLLVSRRFYDSDHCFFKEGEARIELVKIFDEYLYLPAGRMIDSIAGSVSKLQNGRIDRYVLYLFLTIILLIIVIRWIL